MTEEINVRIDSTDSPDEIDRKFRDVGQKMREVIGNQEEPLRREPPEPTIKVVHEPEVKKTG